jgi:hypothetical protein
MTETRRSLLLALALALAGTPAPARAEEQVLCPRSENSWANFHIGSWARFERVTTQGEQKWTQQWKETLLKVEEKQLVLKHEPLGDGAGEANEETRDIVTPWTVTWTVIGKETLQLDGKDVECRILERTHRKSKGTTRSWRGVVDGKEIELKVIAHAEFPDGHVEDDFWRLLKAREEMTAGGRKLACMVSEAVQDTDDGKGKKSRSTYKTWYTTEVPGGVVQQEERGPAEDGKETAWVFKLTDFETVKEE